MVTKTRLIILLFITISNFSCVLNKPYSSNNSSVYRGFSLVALRAEPIDIAWRSSLRALDSLKISITSKKHNNQKALIKGVTREDNSVKISIVGLDNNTSRIAIRVGVFGDQNLSNELLRRIDSNINILRYQDFRN